MSHSVSESGSVEQQIQGFSKVFKNSRPDFRRITINFTHFKKGNCPQNWDAPSQNNFLQRSATLFLLNSKKFRILGHLVTSQRISSKHLRNVYYLLFKGNIQVLKTRSFDITSFTGHQYVSSLDVNETALVQCWSRTKIDSTHINIYMVFRYLFSYKTASYFIMTLILIP